MFVTERELLRADLEDRDVIEPVQAFISGVKAKIGKESFSFIEEIASDTSKANETPWSISAYGNMMRGRWIFGGGVEFQESFKEQSESSVCIPQTDPSGTLVKNGDPPALLGRHAEFDNFWNLIVTPECEPRSNTPRRNHETSRQFKSHTLGV